MNNVMLDLETFGTNNNAIITAIGAVAFDPSTDSIGDRFQVQIDPISCEKRGLKADMSTILWWLKQSSEARAQFELSKIDLGEALGQFTWFLSQVSSSQFKGLKVWGNGATFDNVLIRSAYKAIGEEAPWSFRNDCCYRTLSNLYPEIKQEAVGVAHNGVDDAEYQALKLMKILRAMHKS